MTGKMGKSIRSKIKKRLRTVKRQRVDAMIVTPQTQEHHDSLMRVIEGRSVRLTSPKNAFKYPDAEGAVFAQHKIMKPIDYRSQNLPMAGYTYRGNRRKYDGEQAEYMADLAKSSHPKSLEVLAGGGAILAKTGKRISIQEAELIATAAVRPEVAAIAEAGPANASSAVAAAVAADASSAAAAAADVPIPDSDEERPGMAESDHLRRPLVKDTTRPTRNRPRANAVKKKTKVAAPRSSAAAKGGKSKKA